MQRARTSHEFGTHILLGLRPGSTLADADKRLLERLGPAGVILFGANFARDLPYEEWLAIHRKLVADIREHAGRDEVLICVDHEGTGIIRPPEPITAYGYAREWAGRAAAVATAMGIELASLGVNVNFAPVLDIDAVADSPIIGRRAFGQDAESVRSAGVAFLEALQAQGVLGCPKHFPGHGAAVEDSHVTLPVVDLDLDQLRARELLPFADAVARGARMIMSAHLLFPRIGPDPSTFSSVLLRDVLRDELGFDGVVVTDDIGMPAMARWFSGTDEAVDKALGAGTDLIMVCDYWTDTERAIEIAGAIGNGLRRGRLSEDALQASRQRIARLLGEAPVHQVRALPADVLEAHRRIAPLGRRSSSALSEGQTVRLTAAAGTGDAE